MVFSYPDHRTDVNLLLGLEDMYEVYRRFGNSSEYSSVVTVFNPTSRAVEYRELFDFPMDNSSSPVQFYRIPEVLSVVTKFFCAVPVAPFVDDYMILDRGDTGHPHLFLYRLFVYD